MADMDLPPHHTPAPTYTAPSGAFSDPPCDFLFRSDQQASPGKIGSQGICNEVSRHESGGDADIRSPSGGVIGKGLPGSLRASKSPTVEPVHGKLVILPEIGNYTWKSLCRCLFHTLMAA